MIGPKHSVSKRILKVIAFWPVYVSIVVTIMLIMQFFIVSHI